MWRRAYSTIKPRARPSWRDLISGSVAKSLGLTIVFGSFVVEATQNRKDLDDLRGAYATRFEILRDITEKVRNKQQVDVAQELRVADAVTRNKYRSATDVELDTQLEDFLRMTDLDEAEGNFETITDGIVRENGEQIAATSPPAPVHSSKFL